MRYAIWMLATLCLGTPTGHAVDPFRPAHLVTMCTSLAIEARIDPSGAAGPIVRCERPDGTDRVFVKPAR